MSLMPDILQRLQSINLCLSRIQDTQATDSQNLDTLTQQVHLQSDLLRTQLSLLASQSILLLELIQLRGLDKEFHSGTIDQLNSIIDRAFELTLEDK